METERGEEIRTENDDPMMSNSLQLSHPSEVLLTIPETDTYTEIELHVPLSPSKPESINNGDNDSTLYSGSSTDISVFLSRASGIFETIEHPEDWGAISHSDHSSVWEGNKKMDHSPQKTESTYSRPEKKLIKFAFQIVMLEKTASGIGLLAFIWATVVLLGGFASSLKTIDFGFITMIIFMMGTGVFNHNHQLDSRFFFQAAKVISSRIGRILTILQFAFASICITFSVMRLVENISSEDLYTTNMKVAVYIFYAMALAHGVLFLLKKAYWFWRVSYHKIIQEVSREFGFGVSGVLLVQRFFYDTHWKLSKGSVFNALDFDLVTFAQGLLISNSHKDQLIAIRILNGFISHEKYSAETCRRLETSIETIGRLFKMLTWKYQGDNTIRLLVAKIVERLASDLLVDEIPGAMDCIHSLLTVPEKSQEFTDIELKLNLLGLKILRNLSGNPKNCWKFMETRGLLSVIVRYSKYKNDCIPQSRAQFKIIKQSLMLLATIIRTEGKTGKVLRRSISEIPFTTSNLRDILISEDNNPKLFKLVVETLTDLSMDMDARKKIGSTSGIIKVLLSIFFQLSRTSYECKLIVKGGGLLAILVLQSKRNCSEILNVEGVVEMLIKILSPEKFINHLRGVSYWKIGKKRQERRIVTRRVELMYKTMAMKILRNLCAYAGRKWHDKLKDVVDALPWILEAIMSTENDNKLREASIGLCVQICKFISIEEYTKILRNADYSMEAVARQLLKALEENNTPNITCSCIRRYAIELAIWMMESNASSISNSKEGKLEELLTQVAETTSDLENFHIFSGDVGVAKHPQTISSLVLKAKRLLA
ncbi:ARM repeat superfamily protein [Rhynchospora pubera]|uniref:ARM repeat superfamily protein n=1 Tax=Rhynchospora pubera TaxID=906938 RepID=A0AAV8H957_9POAL|nr:ARM repeat superfamily protein [Rhynchospora pubera]